MPDVFPTLADLLTINGAGISDIEVSDVLNKAPILAALAAAPASDGTLHKYTKETAAPVVGFRAINSGIDNTTGTDELVTIALKILDASHTIDKAWALAYKKGMEAAVEREVKRHIRAALFMAEKQSIYGTGNAADGFTGLADTLDNSDDDMVVDAGGTTPGTGSSVWGFVTNADETDITVIGGNDGNLELGETTEQRVQVFDAEGAPAGSFTGLYTSIIGWLGLQVGSKYSLGRICNITEDSGKGLTDALIAEFLAKFPSDKTPNFLGMSRRSRKQLQQSRTATNATGAPAPFPTEAFGVPIITAESILNTETLRTEAGS